MSSDEAPMSGSFVSLPTLDGIPSGGYPVASHPLLDDCFEEITSFPPPTVVSLDSVDPGFVASRTTSTAPFPVLGTLPHHAQPSAPPPLDLSIIEIPSSRHTVPHPPSFLLARSFGLSPDVQSPISPLPGLDPHDFEAPVCSLRQIPEVVVDHFPGSTSNRVPHFRDMGCRANWPLMAGTGFLFLISFFLGTAAVGIGIAGFVIASSGLLISTLVLSILSLLLLVCSLPFALLIWRYDVQFRKNGAYFIRKSIICPFCCCWPGQKQLVVYEDIEDFAIRHREAKHKFLGCKIDRIPTCDGCDDVAFEIEATIVGKGRLVCSNPKSFEEAEMIRGELMVILERRKGKESHLEEWN